MTPKQINTEARNEDLIAFCQEKERTREELMERFDLNFAQLVRLINSLDQHRGIRLTYVGRKPKGTKAKRLDKRTRAGGGFGTMIMSLEPPVRQWFLGQIRPGMAYTDLCRAIINDAYYDDVGEKLEAAE